MQAASGFIRALAKAQLFLRRIKSCGSRLVEEVLRTIDKAQGSAMQRRATSRAPWAMVGLKILERRGVRLHHRLKIAVSVEDLWRTRFHQAATLGLRLEFYPSPIPSIT